ncbi:translation initiation factor IF-2-like [Meles meles]|uniref:translation initiation factor IF-2-like n=1 Tax=Meles meles TaxID=9662 RepID=UPI001E69E461|nr:translation initiation factor IF-2-like [Meles meles]
MSERQLGEGGQSGPELGALGGSGTVPDRSGPQGAAGSGDTGAGSAEGLSWEVRVPHPARPASPARAAEAPEGGGRQPQGGSRVLGGPMRGWGGTAGAKARRRSRALPPPAPGLPAPSPPPSEGTPLSLPPSRSPGPGGGGGGAGGARPGRTCAPSRAGESPGEHVPRRAGGGESRGRLHCCCCCRRGRRCLFLPPAPSPPRPGRGAPRAELGPARRSVRRAPQAAAAAATVVAAAARAGKLCPFVRSAPEAAGRQRCFLLHHPAPPRRTSTRRTSSTCPAPTTHTPAHLMPGSRVGEGEEPAQPR